MYLDTCIEPWAGGYTDRRLSPSQRSNYALREAALDHRLAVAAAQVGDLVFVEVFPRDVGHDVEQGAFLAAQVVAEGGDPGLIGAEGRVEHEGAARPAVNAVLGRGEV